MNGPCPKDGSGQASSSHSASLQNDNNHNGLVEGRWGCYGSPNTSFRCLDNEERSLAMMARCSSSATSPTSVTTFFEIQTNHLHHHCLPYSDPCIPSAASLDTLTATTSRNAIPCLIESTTRYHFDTDYMKEDQKQYASSDELKCSKTSPKHPSYFKNHAPGAYYSDGSAAAAAAAATSTTTSTSMPRKPIFIDIAPGVRARLRGFDETKACVGRDFFLPCLCFSCATNLFCIMDANYVVCPVCRVVSPLEGGADLDYQGGVGLGFTSDDLVTWQADFRRNINSRGNLMYRSGTEG
uniref:Uncharacterized protein n=1 Tax=Amphora coffeiformis TaxID=265554 RepID=A0A7S3L049_9STRA|mmetsp:Transcript_17521/g.32863  ORF Transcript_17521/g.32863 Transcript_17521/m.32863 type:complete len:296 (+) Transcript_17521:114-1001(+)|eukprot:scaffold1221_cov207-Amphora_coffeaeformis.AAC.14